MPTTTSSLDTSVPGYVKAQKESPTIPSDSKSSLITKECEEIHKLLQKKNAAYGNSALNPLRIFSSADSTEQLRVRIDDKLSRLSNGDPMQEANEDTILDLIGYLILLRIATKKSSSK